MQSLRSAVAWTPGELFQLVRSDIASSRSRMARHSGLSPSTIAARIESLLDLGYLVEDEEQSDRGRKPRKLSLNPHKGVVAAVDIGSRHTRVALVDLSGQLRAVNEYEARLHDDADSFWGWLVEAIEKAQSKLPGKPRVDLLGVGIAIASPVDRQTSQLSHPMHLAGWDAADPAQHLSAELGLPVLVDNDANLMALGEHRIHYPGAANLLFVKLGSAIGAGLVLEGELFSGRSGGAGEIGHMPTDAGAFARTCKCGRSNCLEACFGGAALRERISQEGSASEVDIYREAGSHIGDSLGTLCNVLNPELVILGGKLSQVDALTHSVRAAIYARTLPLAARDLVIAESRNGQDASILGAAWLAIDHLLSPEVVNDAIARGESRAS